MKYIIVPEILKRNYITNTAINGIFIYYQSIFTLANIS